MSKRNLTNVNADNARLKYFNLYVEFEVSIRALAKMHGIENYVEGKVVSLNKVITQLTLKINDSKQMRLMQHKRVRNWLAHKPRNLMLSTKYYDLCEDGIDETLAKIKEKIIHKRGE